MSAIPQHLEAEQAILGTCLFDGDPALAKVEEHVANPVELFFDVRHREVWQRLEKLTQEGKPIALGLVAQMQVTDPVPMEYLGHLQGQGVPLGMLDQYLAIADEYRRKRVGFEASRKFLAALTDQGTDFEASLTEHEQSVFSLRSVKAQRKGIKAGLIEVVDDWDWAHQHKGQLTGLPSGLHDLDKMLWGFQPTDLIIIGARPSQGKTALCCGIASTVACDMKRPVLFFSLESAMKAILRRIICLRGELNQTALRRGEFNNEDMPKINAEQGTLVRSPLHIIDDGDLTVNQIRSIARSYVREHGVKLILLDYLQKVKPNTRQEKRTYEVAEVSTGLKEMAKECDCPVIAAAQLNRESEKDKGRAPRMSDLGDSGQIERDTDVGILIHRLPEQPSPEWQNYHLIVAKQRDGETGNVKVIFRKQFAKFLNQGAE